MQNLMKVVGVQKNNSIPMKIEFPTLRIIEMKPGLWIYSKMTSHSSPMRCYFCACPSSLGSPQTSELQRRDIRVSRSPRVNPRGDRLALFILRVSSCIQMEDIMTSATRAEYRDKKIFLWKQHINSNLNSVWTFQNGKLFLERTRDHWFGFI